MVVEHLTLDIFFGWQVRRSGMIMIFRYFSWVHKIYEHRITSLTLVYWKLVNITFYSEFVFSSFFFTIYTDVNIIYMLSSIEHIYLTQISLYVE